MKISRYRSYCANQIRQYRKTSWTEIVGAVHTPHGTVAVQGWRSDTTADDEGVSMTMVVDSVMYEHRTSTAYQPQYIVTLAKRFAAAVVEEAQHVSRR